MTQEEIFAKAIELPADLQAAFLDEMFRDRAQDRGKMEAMLAAHRQADSLLDTDAMKDETATERTPSLPQHIGDFEILRELGRGGMGVVYEARQKSLKRKVALKVLSSGLGLSSKAILRFRREAEAAGKLHHTNIVPIYTTGEDRGIHYYAMELIDGPSLDAVVRDLKLAQDGSGSAQSDSTGHVLPAWVRETGLYDPESPIAPRSQRASARYVCGANGDSQPPDSAESSASAQFEASSQKLRSSSTTSRGSSYFDAVASMIADVADALDHAHEHGVIHRDVKPSNLLLGPDGRLSINDFGLARMLEQPGMTISGEFVGSPLYMSPEQITAGRVSIDHRTDIYSLGATLYELLTLQPPFPGESRDQVLSQILHKEPVPPRRLNRKVPVDLETICMKAIERDPDRRYQTAEQLAQDLRAYVNRHAISARRIGRIGLVIKYARRNPATTALIVFVPLTLIGSAAAFRAEQLREQKREHQQLVEERQRQINQLGQELLADLFRGQIESSDKYINQAEDLRASSEWLSFHRGLKQLFRQDYEDAISHFERVLEKKPDSVSAKSLLAVAHMWSGNEYTYFRLISDIQRTDAKTIDEKFFLGYANHWGDCRLSYDLLDEVDVERPGLQYVVFLRGMAARVYASICLANLGEKKRFIDRALLDMESAEQWIQETPLKLKELTIAYLHRANIYERLADADPANRVEHMSMVNDSRNQAMALLPRLRKHETFGDAQYAIVMLLSELGKRETLVPIADQWQETRIGYPYAAHFLALRFAALKEYGRAKYWLGQSERKRFDHLNVDTFVKIVDPNLPETLEQLANEARRRVRTRIDSGETQNIVFDVMSLLLMSDKSQLQLIDDDRLDDVILGGQVYQPIRDYFCSHEENKISAEELIERCAKTPAPNASLMHAHFYLGVEAIADHLYDDAKMHFEACRGGAEFMFTVYFVSDLLLQHRSQWESWQLESHNH